jgi:hypothetical protein
MVIYLFCIIKYTYNIKFSNPFGAGLAWILTVRERCFPIARYRNNTYIILYTYIIIVYRQYVNSLPPTQRPRTSYYYTLAFASNTSAKQPFPREKKTGKTIREIISIFPAEVLRIFIKKNYRGRHLYNYTRNRKFQSLRFK